MTAKMILFMMSCSVLAVVPLYFVINAIYSDGVIGRAGLLGVSSFASIFLLETYAGIKYDALPEVVGLVTSFAVFLMWHLFRFHRRVLSMKPDRKEWSEQTVRMKRRA